ncbi:phage Gp37/Gp68 family protein [Candidatus Fermentibacteria bacterium]|nr:phage Gp37/Gp68 family protein [Candidatus Fermentibacteria bacterium]
MGQGSTIEWTDSTWNPVTGCSKVSPGCQNCYAERMALRLQAMGQANYAKGFEVTCHPQALQLPLSWKRPQTVSVNSMSDLFHEEVPDEFIRDVFAVMREASWHTFQVLTKRAERLESLGARLDWPQNVWMGVSVETRDYLPRLDCLRKALAHVRFVSFEPLLEDLGYVDLDGIDWVIVGGESGPAARPMLEEWVAHIRDQCRATGISFFFKQWGGTNKKKAGRVMEGRTWDEWPRSTGISKTETPIRLPRRPTARASVR